MSRCQQLRVERLPLGLCVAQKRGVHAIGCVRGSLMPPEERPPACPGAAG